MNESKYESIKKVLAVFRGKSDIMSQNEAGEIFKTWYNTSEFFDMAIDYINQGDDDGIKFYMLYAIYKRLSTDLPVTLTSRVSAIIDAVLNNCIINRDKLTPSAIQFTNIILSICISITGDLSLLNYLPVDQTLTILSYIVENSHSNRGSAVEITELKRVILDSLYRNPVSPGWMSLILYVFDFIESINEIEPLLPKIIEMLSIHPIPIECITFQEDLFSSENILYSDFRSIQIIYIILRQSIQLSMEALQSEDDIEIKAASTLIEIQLDGNEDLFLNEYFYDYSSEYISMVLEFIRNIYMYEDIFINIVNIFTIVVKYAIAYKESLFSDTYIKTTDTIIECIDSNHDLMSQMVCSIICDFSIDSNNFIDHLKELLNNPTIGTLFFCCSCADKLLIELTPIMEDIFMELNDDEFHQFYFFVYNCCKFFSKRREELIEKALNYFECTPTILYARSMYILASYNADFFKENYLDFLLYWAENLEPSISVILVKIILLLINGSPDVIMKLNGIILRTIDSFEDPGELTNYVNKLFYSLPKNESIQPIYKKIFKMILPTLHTLIFENKEVLQSNASIILQLAYSNNLADFKKLILPFFMQAFNTKIYPCHLRLLDYTKDEWLNDESFLFEVMRMLYNKQNYEYSEVGCLCFSLLYNLIKAVNSPLNSLSYLFSLFDFSFFTSELQSSDLFIINENLRLINCVLEIVTTNSNEDNDLMNFARFVVPHIVQGLVNFYSGKCVLETVDVLQTIMKKLGNQDIVLDCIESNIQQTSNRLEVERYLEEITNSNYGELTLLLEKIISQYRYDSS